MDSSTSVFKNQFPVTYRKVDLQSLARITAAMRNLFRYRIWEIVLGVVPLAMFGGTFFAALLAYARAPGDSSLPALLFFLLLVVFVYVFVLRNWRFYRHLHSMGYPWVDLRQSTEILSMLGRKAYRIPPQEEMAAIPDYEEGNYKSIIAIARRLEK